MLSGASSPPHSSSDRDSPPLSLTASTVQSESEMESALPSPIPSPAPSFSSSSFSPVPSESDATRPLALGMRVDSLTDVPLKSNSPAPDDDSPPDSAWADSGLLL